jgi:hypothetical protein
MTMFHGVPLLALGLVDKPTHGAAELHDMVILYTVAVPFWALVYGGLGHLIDRVLLGGRKRRQGAASRL